MVRIYIISILFLLLGCSDNNDMLPSGSQLLKNSDFSANPDNVSPWVAISSPGFNLGVSGEVFKNGSRSVFIENIDSLNQNTGNWKQSYTGPAPRAGRTLRMRAFLKGENINLRGPGSNIYISMRAFPVQDSRGSSLGRFISSQDRILVTGTFDWRPIELVLNNAPEEIDFITVYLVMGPRVTGRVYFDDVTLTVD
ncbi:hypothetical protein [Cecembia rubra]|nr:hypothetical protein [Cecembia rubra]